MGIDYDGVGGIGIEVTDKIINKLIEKKVFTSEEWEDDECGCIESVGMLYQQAGNSYSGDETYYWLVEGANLTEINANAPKFIEKLAKLGIIITLDDLMVISDMHVY